MPKSLNHFMQIHGILLFHCCPSITYVNHDVFHPINVYVKLKCIAMICFDKFYLLVVYKCLCVYKSMVARVLLLPIFLL
jgi:hypothetical protein